MNTAQSTGNVSALQSELVWVARVSKVCIAESGGIPITRYANSILSHLMLLYVIPLRPRETSFTGFLGQRSESVSVREAALFCHQGKHRISDFNRQIVLTQFHKCNIKYGLQQCSQFCATIVRHIEKAEKSSFYKGKKVCESGSKTSQIYYIHCRLFL